MKSIIIKNKVTVILGKNGVGKTTFLNYIYKQNFIKDSNLYNNIYYANQVPVYLPNDDIDDYVNYRTLNKIEEVLELLELFTLDNSIFRTQKFKKLSGGEKQIINFLTGYLSSNELIIMDEITNHLSMENIQVLCSLINKSNKKFILVTHQKEVLELLNSKEIIELKNYVDFNKVNFNFKLEKNPIKQKISLFYNKLFSKDIFLYLLIFIVCLLVFNSVKITNADFLASIYDSMTLKTTHEFNDNVSVIYPPINNYYFDLLGNKSWTSKTPFYFTNEDLEKLENNKYVKKVIPVPENNGGINSPTTTYNNKEIEVSTELIPCTDKYKKQDLCSQDAEYSVKNLKESKEILEKSSLEMFNYNELVYGTIPDDYSNQIIIDDMYAEYLLKELNLSNKKDLLSKELNFDGYKYVISGISNTKNYKNEIYTGFNDKEQNYVNNAIWLSTEHFVYEDSFGFESPKEAMEYIKNYTTFYNGFFIELKEDKYLEPFTKEILKYDNFIEVDNNITSNKSNYNYIKSFILPFLSKIIPLMIILYLLIILFLNIDNFDNKKRNKILRIYGFNKNDIINLNNVYFKRFYMFLLLTFAILIFRFIFFYFKYKLIINLFMLLLYSIEYLIVIIFIIISCIVINKLNNKNIKELYD
ncbi:MAG: ABC transporter ATP-binding protein [Mycoplasmatales bacterium]